MMKCIVSLTASVLVTGAATAQQARLPDSFVGASIETVERAYGAPSQNVELGAGLNGLVFELTSFESAEAAARMRGSEPVSYRTSSRSHATLQGLTQTSLTSRRNPARNAIPGARSDIRNSMRPVPVTCRIGMTLDSSGAVQDVVVSDPACRTLSLR